MPIYKTPKKNSEGVQQYRVNVSYTDNTGKKRGLTRMVYGLSAAKDTELILSSQVDKTASLTVSQLVQEYQRLQKSEIRETTMTKNLQILKNHVLPYFGTTKIDKLTVKKLTDWKQYILGKELSHRMCHNIYRVFVTLLNFATKMEYIEKNPLGKVGNFKNPYKKSEKIQYYTVDEFTKFIKVAKEEAERTGNYSFYVFFNIAFYTGARKGEINALTWEDIDGDILRINKSVTQKSKGKDFISPPKTHSSNRNLQMPKVLIEILEEHHERMAKFKDFEECFFICGGLNCVRNSSLTRENRRYSELAELHHIRVHDFRHSHATLLANNGINITEVSRRLGHSNITQTLNTYSHFYPQEEERAVSLIDTLARK